MSVPDVTDLQGESGLSRLVSTLAYTFRQPQLLQQALTHRSYGNPHNERLEFIGDGILDCIVARLLFDAFPQASEGDLSRWRANLVNQRQLAELAQQLQLGHLLCIGDGEEKSGGRQRPSMMADALEALFGAIWLDGGFDAASAAIGRLYQPLIASYNPVTQGKDPKTRLQEWLQGRRQPVPEYHVVRVIGKSHDQQFEVECRLSGFNLTTSGLAGSRRAAEQQAAEAALLHLEQS